MSKMRNRIASALLAGTVAVTTLLSGLTTIPAQAETNANHYNYAVQLYGIGQDTLEDGTTAGLTFGPALGANWSHEKMPANHNPSGTTSAGHDYRCIMTDYNDADGWSTIIAWNNLDPDVYTACIDNHCTITVHMTLTDENSATDSQDTSKVFHSKVGESTGNGSGVYYGEIQINQRCYALSQNDAVNWENSNVRAMLNGYEGGTYAKSYSEANSFLSAFPEELRNAIGAKAVQYASSRTDKTIQTVYDKLWLFSAYEIYGGAEASEYSYAEGTRYTRTQRITPSNVDAVKLYNYKRDSSPDNLAWTWLRTLNANYGRVTVAFSAAASYPLNKNTVNNANKIGVAPGFVLRRDIPDDPTIEEDGSDAGHAQECHHQYAWEVYRKATALEDGIMRYRCQYCGDVEYEVPMAAYYVFNKETQESIRDAAPNATVRVSTPIFISFHEMVRDSLQERPDVTLVVEYRYAGDLYEMTIPAGSGDTLEQLFGESQYAGFLYLGGAFYTIAK